MSFTIQHGLFRANITDYHAILGVSLNAEPKKIRLKYLRTAQKLHPDTCKADPKEKKLASQILSRLVNPAYQELCNKSQFAEHQLILTQIGKRYAESGERISVASEPAKQLLQTSQNIDQTYHKLLQELVVNQYSNINKVLLKIAVISELNLVYLILKHKQGINREERVVTQRSAPPTKQSTASQSVPNSAPDKEPAEEPTPSSRVASYVRRAKEYMAKRQFSNVVSELRDALKIDPNNSTVHGLMGQAYILQNQATMAKVHINKAHEANPQDPVVIQAKEQLEKLLKKQKNRATKSTAKNSESKNKNDSGFFSGFFGAKKK